MRRQDQVIAAKQTRTRRRFLRQNIQSGSGELSGIECVRQGTSSTIGPRVMTGQCQFLEQVDLTSEQRKMILGGNAARVLKL